MGLSTDLSIDAYRYTLKDLWGKMSHLGSKTAKNPLTQMDQSVQAMVDYPKRDAILHYQTRTLIKNSMLSNNQSSMKN